MQLGKKSESHPSLDIVAEKGRGLSVEHANEVSLIYE